MITIFTPTYNRCDKLKILYESLLRQSDKDFIWLIIDDGSSDNTKKFVDNWKKSINIEYIYQPNSGKHIAMNNAFLKCKTKYIMCVDSDDFLSHNAISIINNELLKYFDKDTWGIVGPRVHRNGELSSEWKIDNKTKCKFANIYCKYKYIGDTYIIMDINFIKGFKFNKIKNEKFMPENVLYDYLDINYNIKATNKSIYISDYYEDGYTKNSLKLFSEAPRGISLANLSIVNNKYNSFKKRVLAFTRYKVIKKIYIKDIQFDDYNVYNIPKGIKIVSYCIYPLMYIHYYKRKM